MMIKKSKYNRNYEIIKSDFEEAKYLFLNSAKSAKQLNWKPFFSIDKTLEQIIEWNKVGNKKKYIESIVENYLFNCT